MLRNLVFVASNMLRHGCSTLAPLRGLGVGAATDTAIVG